MTFNMLDYMGTFFELAIVFAIVFAAGLLLAAQLRLGLSVGTTGSVLVLAAVVLVAAFTAYSVVFAPPAPDDEPAICYDKQGPYKC